MYLKNISLLNFKNYSQESFLFSSKINCLVGLNGIGKTNVIDAIHYLGLTKSYFNSIDSQNIKHNEEFMVVEGIFLKNDEEYDIYCGVKRNTKKVFKKNKKDYSKLADHIGLLPMVMVSPSDYGLILDGSEERRKFLNGVISQYDKEYLDDLIKYNRILQQRNKLLKDMAGRQGGSDDLIEVLDAQLTPLGEKVYKKRKAFTTDLIPVFQEFYEYISNGNEKIELIYDSQLNDKSFSELLTSNRAKDKIIQYTTAGIHKDELVLKLGDYPIKKVGSQGQQKTYLLALKLAKFNFIEKISGLKPILLLDDIFDKLDAERVEKILTLVSENRFGQIFITDTSYDRIKSILSNVEVESKYFLIEKESVKTIE